MHDRPPPLEIARDARRRLLADELSFSDFLAQHGLSIHARDFLPAGTWVTPEFSPIRFATQYFLHYVHHDQRAELIEGEIIGLDWLTPGEARQRGIAGEIKVSTPWLTRCVNWLPPACPPAPAAVVRGTERVPGEHNWFEIRRGITLVPLKMPRFRPPRIRIA